VLVKLLGHRTVNTTLRYLLAQLDHEAKARRVTRSWLVRESLERALSKESPASNAKRLRPTLLTCEPVLTEAAFLLKCDDRDADALFEREVVMRADAAVDHGHADPVPFHPDCISSSPPVRPSGVNR